MMFISSMPRARAVIASAVALLALAGCASASRVSQSLSTLGGTLTPYKSDVLQGNVVTREQFQALKRGMPREQVRGILGTPLLASAFHADRWDYVFTFRRQGQEPQQRRVTVFFSGDALDRFQADELPTEAEFVASLDARRKGAKVPPLQASEEALRAFRAEGDRQQPQPAPAAAPAASYPPLESR